MLQKQKQGQITYGKIITPLVKMQYKEYHQKIFDKHYSQQKYSKNNQNIKVSQYNYFENQIQRINGNQQNLQSPMVNPKNKNNVSRAFTNILTNKNQLKPTTKTINFNQLPNYSQANKFQQDKKVKFKNIRQQHANSHKIQGSQKPIISQNKLIQRKNNITHQGQNIQKASSNYENKQSSLKKTQKILQQKIDTLINKFTQIKQKYQKSIDKKQKLSISNLIKIKNKNNKINQIEKNIIKSNRQNLQNNNNKQQQQIKIKKNISFKPYQYNKILNQKNQKDKKQFKIILEFKKSKNQQKNIINNNIKLKCNQNQNIKEISSLASTGETQCKQIIKQPNQKQSNCKYYVNSIIQAYAVSMPSKHHRLCRNHIQHSISILNNQKYHNIFNINPVHKFPLKIDKNDKITLVFDLDQTLIHCTHSLTSPHHHSITIKLPNATVTTGFNVRPFAVQALKQLSKYFQLMIFTASHPYYANTVIDNLLDPNKQLIKARYYRDDCIKMDDGNFVKDLRVINRDITKILLIDNAAYSYSLQLENGVPILPFLDDQNDTQLVSLVDYLKSRLTQDDVRENNKNYFKLEQYRGYKTGKQITQNLYQNFK